MTVDGRHRPRGHDWNRYAAPVAFLVAATIAVLIVRSGLEHGAAPATATAPTRSTPARAKKPKTAKPAKTKAKRKTTTGATTTAAPSGHAYTVVAGDTFSVIAAKQGTTVAEIERLNPGVSTTALYVGQELRVP